MRVSRTLAALEMGAGMTAAHPPKGHYTEAEVANTLGVSIEELRKLVRSHIVECEEDLANLSKTWFQPADVLLLRLLTSNPAQATIAG
jgi:hypothetical protein